MYIFLVFFIVILNYSIFSFLKTKNVLKKMFLFLIIFFFATVILTKIYNFLSIDGMPDGFGFFILLNFSWGIVLLNFIKILINRRVNIIENLEKDFSFQYFSYLTVITIIITALQLFLVLSKTIYIFKS
jgi:hypothetical protein